MKLREVLLHKIPAGSYVEITDQGWRIGFTYIDNEDLFIHSLNPKMLDQIVDNISTKIVKNIAVEIYSIALK